jgi:Phosphopantetheine attachment site
VTLPLGDGEGMAPAASQSGTSCRTRRWTVSVLGVFSCGNGSDFFDLGGRSIQAMMLAGQISTARGIRISTADLFKASTLGDMNGRLDLMADARK